MQVWKHKKTGGLYVILGGCRIESANERCVRYQSIEHNKPDYEWVRPEDEFFERFERVEITATKQL